MGDETDRLQVFEEGGAIEVPVARIESELAALWRRAAEARPGQIPNCVTRACLWNLVVRVHGEAEFTKAKRVIDELSQRIPARTIVMRIEPDGPDLLRAWVEANWRRREGGGAASGSDEVTLWASGKAIERVASLVRALVVSDAPTAMFWMAALPPDSALVREMVHQSDRLIIDTRRLADERRLGELCAIGVREPELQLADLSWIGISPLRGMCAALFDPPRDPSVLFRLDRVRVVSNIHGTQARGLLMLGWLMSRLGWSGARRIEEQQGTRRWQATRKDGKPVSIELSTEPGGDHGVAAMELHAGGDVWSLVRDTSIHVRGPDLPPRSQPARSHSDSELLVSALGTRGNDYVFRDALARAVELVQS